jgi:hypothetical protein
MLYVLVIPIIFAAVIIKLVANRYGLKLFEIICNFVIIIGAIVFLYLFAAYNGFDVIELVYNFLFVKK